MTTAAEIKGGLVDARTAVDLHYKRTIAVQTGQILSVPSGLIDLDKILAGGYKGSTLNTLAGVTGMGKTAGLTTLTRNMALAGGVPVLFSLEQPVSQLVSRMIADKVKVPIDTFDMQGGLTQGNMADLIIEGDALAQLRFFIDDTAGQNVQRICDQIQKLHEDQKITVALVDYLQMVRPSREVRMRYLEISNVLSHFHELAMKLDIPIILGAQLSREVFNRADRRPTLRDLRESGDIEQYSYTVTFLHRDDYWDPISLHKGVAELIVAKHRQGKTGVAKAVFMGQYSRLENMVLTNLNPPHIPPAPVPVTI